MPTATATRPAKKATKKITKGAKVVTKPRWRRPVRVALEAQFAEGGRKVVVEDIQRAAAAAGAAFRASLEGRKAPYDIERLEVQVDYSYLQSRSTFDA